MRALALTLAFLIGAGCAPQGETDWQGVPADAALDELVSDEAFEDGARRNLVLTSPGIYHSDPLPLTITGLNPGETVHLLRGGSTASGPCPSQIGGLCLDLGGNATYLGNQTADASGVAVFTVTIPSQYEGNTVALQATAVRGTGGVNSVKTNVISGAIQAPGSAGLTADDLVPGDLVISEVMQNPSAVADSDGEWIEIYNNAGSDVDLDGLVISDLGSDSHTVTGPVIVPAGGYAVLGRNIDPNLNGGVTLDYAYSGITLSNGADEVVLSNVGGLLDSAEYDGGTAWPDPSGASMQLSAPLLDDLSNDYGSSWCESTSIFGAGDAGTPGAANDDCGAGPAETCSDGIQNQNETGIDCGGVCPSCTNEPPSYLTDEDFETGDFSVFPYAFTGTEYWSIETDAASCHGGSYCMRTNPAHPLDDTSTIEVPLSVRQDGDISFWVETNTEPGEHYFRFYIDGVLQLELSGQNPYQQYTFPVTATGANGPDRVFTWEYSRSTFMSQTHVPWNEVWVDDIDFPEWNTQPGVPVLDAPGNHTLVDASPTFEWLATDPDFDNVTYEFQYDDDPTFPTPSTSGETYATSDQPQLADGIWYWRVRSKDDSDYRWSDWSETRTVEVDAAAEYPISWQQRVGAQFEMNDVLGDMEVSGDAVITSGTQDSSFATGQYAESSGWTGTLSNLPSTNDTTGTLQVCVQGDFDNVVDIEYLSYVNIDGVRVLTTWYPYSSSRSCYDISIDPTQYVNDGTVTIDMDASSGVGSGWLGEATLTYATNGTGTVISQPIHFSDFAASSTVWDRVHWIGDELEVRVLDENMDLIPEADLPGNAAGFTSGTLHLFDVNPVDYPIIHLQADTIGPIGTLYEWRVVANDGFEWTFEYDLFDEGWEAYDDGATPTLSVGSGMLIFDGLAAGTNPRVEYWFPQPIDATRFSTLEMVVRTSNNYINDDPTLYWASNFGAFDSRRSIVDPQVYLFTFQTITYDLTQAPVAPQEPWQGMVEAIRLDPVQAFEDQLGNPADGWFEIESVKLH